MAVSPAMARAGKAIRDARLRAGLTQEEAVGGRATSTLSRWETGHDRPKWTDLDKYAHEIGQPIILHFGPDTTKEPPPVWAEALRVEVQATRTAAEANAIQLAALQAVLAAIQSQLLPPDDDPPDDREPSRHSQRQRR